jgi:hypothetical protein
VERAKRATNCWLVITTAESPPGDQSAGGACGGSSDQLRDALALHEVRGECRCDDPSSDRSHSLSWGRWSEWSRLRHHGEGHFWAEVES